MKARPESKKSSAPLGTRRGVPLGGALKRKPVRRGLAARLRRVQRDIRRAQKAPCDRSMKRGTALQLFRTAAQRLHLRSGVMNDAIDILRAAIAAKTRQLAVGSLQSAAHANRMIVTRDDVLSAAAAPLRMRHDIDADVRKMFASHRLVPRTPKKRSAA